MAGFYHSQSRACKDMRVKSLRSSIIYLKTTYESINFPYAV